MIELDYYFRHYRQARIDTPSHPGGVSNAVRDRQHDRHNREKDKGVYASSKHRDGDRKKDRKDRERDRRYDRDRDRDRHRNRDRERDRDRKKDRDRGKYS